METPDWFDQKTALFIADTLDMGERLKEINKKILEKLETPSATPDSLQIGVQPKHLSDDQGLTGDSNNSQAQFIPHHQKHQYPGHKVIYLLLPSDLTLKKDGDSPYPNEK